MKKYIPCLILILALMLIPSNLKAQEEQSLSLDDQLNQLEADTNNAIEKLKKERDKKTSNKLKLIERKIIRALNSIPPDKCLGKLKVAMDDFFGLVSDLSSGISCGPSIIPPFLPGTENTDSPITPDCLPPEMRTPFNGAFSLVNPLYDDALNIFRTDINENEMPDVCEGDI